MRYPGLENEMHLPVQRQKTHPRSDTQKAQGSRYLSQEAAGTIQEVLATRLPPNEEEKGSEIKRGSSAGSLAEYCRPT
jgi:hypothetical protein